MANGYDSKLQCVDLGSQSFCIQAFMYISIVFIGPFCTVCCSISVLSDLHKMHLPCTAVAAQMSLPAGK